MNEKNNIDIDYENMDDLPLSDHVEWNYFNIKEQDLNDPDEHLNQAIYS